MKELQDILHSRYGYTGWWPGDTPDEVVIGAILTQNTSWSNVERSLGNLREAGMLSLKKISESDLNQLSGLIRSSGFHNQKSARLKDLAARIIETFGSIERMRNHLRGDVEDFLRPIKGIGQETLDAILLYALDKPVFVVDKYTLRIFQRTGIDPEATIGRAKAAVESELGSDVQMLKNLHGMIVYLAKDFCKTKPQCSDCPVRKRCAFHLEREKSD